MNSSDLKCRKCGDTLFEASSHGAYLKRVSPKGEAFEGECSPSCDMNHGNQDDALINALEDD
ncbi:MAG: hypothetical protein KAR42_15650 [candidate division Zixibacteria bacterium]|nr:hypothetical protein [candidate division Zixibacteria bacterium]